MAQEVRFCRRCRAVLAANEGREIAGGGWGCDDYPKCAEAHAPQPVSPSKSSDGLARFSEQTAKIAGAVVVVEKWGDHTYVAGPDRKDQVVLFVAHHDYFKIVFMRDILGVRLAPTNYQI